MNPSFIAVHPAFDCPPLTRTLLLSGSGLGKLVAERLARDNNTLHCVDINTAQNEEAAQGLRKQGDCTVYTYTCNVGSMEEVRELGRQIKKNTPDKHISYLFNIAGTLDKHISYLFNIAGTPDKHISYLFKGAGGGPDMTHHGN